jgi:hypothetical protein
MQNKKEDSVLKMGEVKSIKKVFLACIEEQKIKHYMVLRLGYKVTCRLKAMGSLLQHSMGTTKSKLFSANANFKRQY